MRPRVFWLFLFGFVFVLSLVGKVAANPASSTYKLQSYDIGSGGTVNSASSSYSLEGIAGTASGGESLSSSYTAKPGFVYSEQANVPDAPTFTNPGSSSSSLHFVIDTGSNPSDAKFAIAISDDNFTTTNYIQDDNTVGGTLGTEDYQTYANWGSGSGEDVVGLTASTTYKIKVKATDGKYTESGYSQTASATTSASSATLSFSINTDSQPTAPFSINLGTLTASTVTTATDHINVSFDTNANLGGEVYIFDQNGALSSSITGDSIPSASADLSSASSGYGAQATSASQSSGGPFTSQSPYNVSSHNVGVLSTLIRPIFSAGSAVTGGTGSLYLKAKPSTITKPATDYVDTITLIAAGNF